MKVETNARPRMTLEEFADTHGLTMEVHERSGLYGFPEGHSSRWYAHFKNAEVRHGESCLRSAYGNGRTPEEAIANYEPEISEQELIVNAGTPARREIPVPIIVRASTTPSKSGGPEQPREEKP